MEYFSADAAAIIFVEKLKDFLKALNVYFPEFVNHTDYKRIV